MAGEQAGRRGKPVRKRQNPDLPQGNPASERRRGKGLIRGFFGSCLRLALRGTAWVSIRLAVVFLLVFAPWTLHYFNSLPPAAELMDDRSNGAVTLLDRNDEVFAWRGDQFGGLVSSKTVSPHLKNAILVAEDKRFYRHFGISLKGIAGAVFINLREGRSPFSGHGGSTITQQVAKRVFFPELRSFNRKVREVPMAMAMELRYGKDEILNIYLNRVYLGAGTFGFEAASQRYFGKSARNVDPSEAAMLAGLLKAPSRYAPTRNLEGARSRGPADHRHDGSRRLPLTGRSDPRQEQPGKPVPCCGPPRQGGTLLTGLWKRDQVSSSRIPPRTSSSERHSTMTSRTRPKRPSRRFLQKRSEKARARRLPSS